MPIRKKHTLNIYPLRRRLCSTRKIFSLNLKTSKIASPNQNFFRMELSWLYTILALLVATLIFLIKNKKNQAEEPQQRYNLRLILVKSGSNDILGQGHEDLLKPKAVPDVRPEDLIAMDRLILTLIEKRL